MTKTRTLSTAVTGSRKADAVALPSGTAPSLALVVGVIDSACCWVTFADNPSVQAQKAWVLKHVGEVIPGHSVLLQFLSGDATRPVVTGIVLTTDTSTLPVKATREATAIPATLEINSETLMLCAQQRITLRCGMASLVMNADGTIEIRGTELLSRASGQNAIRGASISLN